MPPYRRRPQTLIVYACLVVAAGLVGLPFFWMIVTSLKSPAEIVQYPPTWWPGRIRWENYAEAWQAAPFGRFYLNSVVTGAAATVLQVVLALFMAYAFALVRFPGKSFLFLLVLATMMIPLEMKLIPNYLLLNKLNWIDTYWALIVPPAAHAFPVFVFHEQFKTLPRDLIDAAKVDGAGHLRILATLVIPLSRPVVAAVTLIALLGRWNDYLWPLIVTNREVMRTLPVGLAYLKESQEGGLRWNILMAGSVFVIIPMLVLFLCVQRQFVEGITRGAVKG